MAKKPNYTDWDFSKMGKQASVSVGSPKAPPLTCPSKRIVAVRCSGGSFNHVLSPGYQIGVVSWDPNVSVNQPLNRCNLINGQNPQLGDHFEVPAQILSTNCSTGVQTLRNIPASEQGHYYVASVTGWNPNQWPASYTPIEFVDYPLSTAPTCDYIGNPLKVCLCSVGPGGTGTVGQIFDSMVGTGTFGGSTSPSGVQIPGRFFGNNTVDGTTPVVGQEIEVTQAGIDYFVTTYANWVWGGNTGMLNFPTNPPGMTDLSDLIGVLKVMEVYPQHDYWNSTPPFTSIFGPHWTWTFNSSSLGQCGAPGVCGNPMPPCDTVAWSNIPFGYFTTWQHLPSMFYNPPVALPTWWGLGPTSTGGTGIPPGAPMFNPTANIDYENQSSLCEWCDDWIQSGGIPGTFDNRVLNWGMTLAQAEGFCGCCPSSGGPMSIPPTGVTQ